MGLKINRIFQTKARSHGMAVIAAGIIFGNFMILSPAARAQVNVSLSKQSDQSLSDFCADPALGAQPCPILPIDVTEFDANFIYRFVGPESQRPFDRFSWQAFIAMTWPMAENGHPVPYAQTFDPDNIATVPRWQQLVIRDQLISGDDRDGSTGAFAEASSFCSGDIQAASQQTRDPLLLYAFRQATGDVLVDQAGNYVLYETRLNDVAADYIRDNHLATFAGRANRANLGQEISFPLHGDVIGTKEGGGGSAAANANGADKIGPGATLLKFAWRVLTPKDDPARFLTRNARLFVPARDSLSGKPFCRDAVVGLIGMHLVQRVASGNGNRWIWSTFEHVANAPLAGNARRPNSFIAKKLFADGCAAPGGQDAAPLATTTDDDVAKSQRFNLFDPAGMMAGISEMAGGGESLLPIPAMPGDDVTNKEFAGRAMWAQQPPYAVDRAGQAIVPSQIVRCWRVFEGTQKTNDHWHQALAGSVWANYFLVGTQWIGNGGGVPFGVGEVPRFLSNVALESFIQHQETGTCLGCHNTARSDAGQASNFTFVLAPVN